jgi:hypothetical protein
MRALPLLLAFAAASAAAPTRQLTPKNGTGCEHVSVDMSGKSGDDAYKWGCTVCGQYKTSTAAGGDDCTFVKQKAIMNSKTGGMPCVAVKAFKAQKDSKGWTDVCAESTLTCGKADRGKQHACGRNYVFDDTKKTEKCGAAGCTDTVCCKIGGTGMTKVVSMLEELSKKVDEEGKEEAKQWAKYEQWGKDTKKSTADDIKTLGDDITGFKGAIADAETQIGKAQKTLDEKLPEIVKLETELADETKTWNEKKKAITLKEADALAGSVACTAAMQHLDALGFVETQSVLNALSPKHRAILTPLLQTEQTPRAAAYEKKSSSIKDMIKKLKDKFLQEEKDAQAEFTKEKSAFNSLKIDNRASFKAATQAVTDAKQTKADNEQTKAEKEQSLSETEVSKKKQEDFLEEVTKQLDEKTKIFNQRKKMREDEKAAIDKAKGVIEGMTSFMQVSLLQIDGRAQQSPASTSAIQRASELLSMAGARLKSPELSQLALKAAADPFVKVRAMIEALINRLQQQAAQEAERDQWCKGELSRSEATRNKLTADIEKETAEKEQTEGELFGLKEQIAVAKATSAARAAELKDATALREQEKKDNKKAIEDAGKAKKTVDSAIKILKDFYAEAANAKVTLVQAQAAPAPELGFDKAYTGNTGNVGVVGLLETISSDFERVAKETAEEEKEAKAEFTKFERESRVATAGLDQEAKNKEAEKANLDKRLADLKSAIAANKKDLEAADKYYNEDLTKSCLDTGLSYEERVQKRNDEIKSLEDALKILEDSTN